MAAELRARGHAGHGLQALARERPRQLRFGRGRDRAQRSHPLRGGRPAGRLARERRSARCHDEADRGHRASRARRFSCRSGNPYLISAVPEVGSYLIGWRANAVTEQAVARALAGETAITGRSADLVTAGYRRGWGVQRRVR